MSKRRRSPSVKREDDFAVDIEDSFIPASSSVLSNKLSNLAYSGSERKTRAAVKRLKPDADATLSETAKSRKAQSTPKRKIEAPPASPRKAKPIQMGLDVPHPEPPHWRETYHLIKEMRRDIEAPVDTMGCASAMKDEQDPKVNKEPILRFGLADGLAQVRRFGTLISLMLSSQTKDEVTADAVRKLEAALGPLSVQNVIKADDEAIQGAICKVGFWRRKTG